MKLRRRGINSSGRLASRKSYILAMAMAMAMAMGRSDLKGLFFTAIGERRRKNTERITCPSRICVCESYGTIELPFDTNPGRKNKISHPTWLDENGESVEGIRGWTKGAERWGGIRANNSKTVGNYSKQISEVSN